MPFFRELERLSGAASSATATLRTRRPGRFPAPKSAKREFFPGLQELFDYRSFASPQEVPENLPDAPERAGLDEVVRRFFEMRRNGIPGRAAAVLPVVGNADSAPACTGAERPGRCRGRRPAGPFRGLRSSLLGCAAAGRAKVPACGFDRTAAGSGSALGARDKARAFTTGSCAAGCGLASVELPVAPVSAGEIDGPDASVRTPDPTTGHPLAKRFGLAGPAQGARAESAPAAAGGRHDRASAGPGHRRRAGRDSWR